MGEIPFSILSIHIVSKSIYYLIKSRTRTTVNKYIFLLLLSTIIVNYLNKLDYDISHGIHNSLFITVINVLNVQYFKYLYVI